MDCVLALKSFSESNKTGRQASCNYGGLSKHLTARKYFILKNTDAFMNKIMKGHSAEAIQSEFSEGQSIVTDFSIESNEMVRTIIWSDFFWAQSCLYFEMTFTFLFTDYFRLP